jgi:hypothetical protein
LGELAPLVKSTNFKSIKELLEVDKESIREFLGKE